MMHILGSKLKWSKLDFTLIFRPKDILTKRLSTVERNVKYMIVRFGHSVFERAVNKNDKE